MASFKFKGMIPDDDPRYQEGITILIGLGLNEKPKGKNDSDRSGAGRVKRASTSNSARKT